jgi:aspartate aminotransferase
MQLSQRVLQMEESATLAMAGKARALKAQGIDVINLSLGEPDFDTPGHIKDAAKDGLDKGYTKYTPVNGLAELRQAISEKFKRDNGLDYSPEQIVVSNGAKQSIANIFFALLDEDDEVIVLSPYWVSYVSMIEMAGGKAVIVSAGVDQDFKPSPEEIEKAITPKTKAVIFSSPCNPSGAVWSEQELNGLATMASGHPDLIFISDEIYEYINFQGKHASLAAQPGMMSRTVTVNGFSKGFAMTGWRLGYIGAPTEMANACTKIQGQYTSGANSFAQYAGAEALLADMQATQDMKEAYLKRRGLVMDRLKQIPGIATSLPEGAFYAFPDVSSYFGKSANGSVIKDADDLSMFLLEKAHVAVVSGSAFGAPECIRISFAASEDELNSAFDAIEKALAVLR